MRRTPFFLATALMAAAFAGPQALLAQAAAPAARPAAPAGVQASKIQITGAFTREMPPGAPAMGGFLVVKNLHAGVLRLVGAESPAFNKVELHETRSENGMMRMVALPVVEVPAGGSFEFKPGGAHLMLIGPKAQAKAGEKLPVTLLFGSGGAAPLKVNVQLEVRAAGGHHGGHH